MIRSGTRGLLWCATRFIPPPFAVSSRAPQGLRVGIVGRHRRLSAASCGRGAVSQRLVAHGLRDCERDRLAEGGKALWQAGSSRLRGWFEPWSHGPVEPRTLPRWSAGSWPSIRWHERLGVTETSTCSSQRTRESGWGADRAGGLRRTRDESGSPWLPTGEDEDAFGSTRQRLSSSPRVSRPIEARRCVA